MVDLGLYVPAFFAYLGKSIELITGIFIALGLFTRIAVIPLALTMLFICFVIGKGRIFMEEQHPFLFVLLCLLYFFTGSGKWSLDNLLFNRQKATIV
jgi:putative oxidoreductase